MLSQNKQKVPHTFASCHQNKGNSHFHTVVNICTKRNKSSYAKAETIFSLLFMVEFSEQMLHK